MKDTNVIWRNKEMEHTIEPTIVISPKESPLSVCSYEYVYVFNVFISKSQTKNYLSKIEWSWGTGRRTFILEPIYFKYDCGLEQAS